MNGNPKFSVIIPIYNVAKYLEKAINSVLSQSYLDYELILVDDGSVDDSSSICDYYAIVDRRVRVIHKENGGLVSARIEGAKLARGEYSLCLDGDDWINCNSLSLIAKTIDENGKPDIICFGITNAYENNETQSTMRNRVGFYSKQNIIEEIFPMLIQRENATYFAPSLCGKAIKTELYKEQQLRVPPEIVIGEDGACTIPCVYRANTLYIMKEYLYYYRQNMSSVTKKRKTLSWNIPILNSNHICNTIDIERYDFKEQLYRKVCHDTFLVVVAAFYTSDCYCKVKKSIKDGLAQPVIAESIKKAKFKHSIKAWLMMTMLRFEIYFPFKIYSMIR